MAPHLARCLAPKPARALLLAGLAMALVGAPCGRSFKSVAVDSPRNGHLVDDPSGTIASAGRVGTNFDEASVEVRLDGVDLIAALSLTPPFTDVGGTLVIGSDVVTVSGFDFKLTNPRRIELVASGLSQGAHDLEVEAEKIGGGLVLDAAAFEVIAAFQSKASHVAAAGSGPQHAGSQGILFSSSLGEPLAALPVGLSGGGQLRSGFVEVSEALSSGGAP